jgi:hypothetical protein
MIVRRLLACALLTGLALPLLAAAPEQQAPSPAPAAAADETPLPPPVATGPSPEVAARARAVFDANRAGKIDRTQYTADMNERITDSALAHAANELRSLGEVKSFTQVRKITSGPVTIYVFRIELAKPPVVEEIVGWNAAGQVRFLQFGAAPQ